MSEATPLTRSERFSLVSLLWAVLSWPFVARADDV
jgi:hypothetical protein